MTTQYTPERYTIGNLLSTTNPPIRVPDWQRNYSWTTSEVEVFWKDLLGFDDRYPGDNLVTNEYFLGSVVLVDNKTWNLLLDGQQRLATAAILISVIRDFLATYNQNAATRTSNKFLQDYDDASQQSVDKITLNRYDRDFFRREILEVRSGQYAPPIATLDSHHLIRKAREYLHSRFAERRDVLANPEQFNSWVLRIQKVLTQHVSVVAIVSQDEDNAAQVFETLNDRGIGLSTPDLLRNLVMRRAVEAQREEIAGLWGEILAAESDVKLKTFLRHFWISKEGDVKAQSLYREIKDTIVTDNIESLGFSREVRDASLQYRDILNAQTDDAALNRSLESIAEVNATNAYPVLLAALQVAWSDEAVRRLSDALLVTYIRHSVIGRLDSTIIENLFWGLARNVRQNENVDAAIQLLREYAIPDEQFAAAFRTATVKDRGIARYLLREIELATRRTEELEVALPPKVHVEHIYPQTPLPGQRWENHDAYIHRLGNLTLLSRRINTAIKNAPFADKKTQYAESDLEITRRLIALEDWSAQQIEQRQTVLAALATTVWPIPA